MIETIEERLQDLERLILKQSERIDELESQLKAAIHMAAVRSGRATPPVEKNAA